MLETLAHIVTIVALGPLAFGWFVIWSNLGSDSALPEYRNINAVSACGVLLLIAGGAWFVAALAGFA